MTKAVLLFEVWSGKLSKLMLYLSLPALVVIAVGTFADVFGRYLFDSPIKGMYEVTQSMMAVVVFAGVAYATHTKGHVAVDLLFIHFPQRVRTFIEVIISILGLTAFGLIVWQGSRMAILAYKNHALTDVLSIPLFPFKLLLPIAVFLSCIVLLSQLFLALNQLLTKYEEEH